MKIALLALSAPLLAYAADTASYLTLTYQTQVGTSVVTASTSISIGASNATATGSCSASAAAGRRSVKWPRLKQGDGHDHGHDHKHEKRAATSYSLNPSVLAYPTFSSVPLSIATSSPEPGLGNSSSLLKEATELVFLLKQASESNCETCQTVFQGLKKTMKVRQETLAIIAEPFCQGFSEFIAVPICVGLLNIASTDIGGIFPEMNMEGKDGQTLCAFMFGVCDLPSAPVLDLPALFNHTTKPKPKTLVPSTKEPLKVLHISDYHLDPRYVVGSEAACTGPVCCRVYPYTNTSIPIVQPAELYGSYLCDTPEALATSVFRGVPKATGLQWCDFAFGIFTGDLVSHDLWELDSEYVLANELVSYQQFFNGMEGVTMYPTLGT